MGITNILTFSTGGIGDVLASVPSLHVLKSAHPEAKITLLYDRQVNAPLIPPTAFLEGSGLVDDFISYDVTSHAGIRDIRQMWDLLWKLRNLRFDALAYLAPSRKSPARALRDKVFFRMAKIPRLWAFPKEKHYWDIADRPLPELPCEADILLSRLSESGLETPAAGEGSMGLQLGERENTGVERWLETMTQPDNGAPWVAAGVAALAPVKSWGIDRYVEVFRSLIERYDIWPVVFGGKEDTGLGDDFIERCGRGYNAAGALSVRESCSAMERCKMYLGNDTGPMHLAVSACLRCVAVFAAHDFPGKWHPYGQGHVVFRNRPKCEGCRLVWECPNYGKKCITDITTEEVTQAAANVLAEVLSGAGTT